jgi:hypothetical protein
MAKAPTKVDPKIAAITAYYEANKEKNAATTRENKAKKELEVLFADADKPFEYAITNDLTLKVGEFTEDEFYIDPKKVLELYPDEFWSLVSIAKTNAEKVLGTKGATKCTKVQTVTKFAIKKEKNSTAK